VAVAATALGPPLSARQLPPFGGADDFRADLNARREKTMAALGAESILVAWSAPARLYSNDVNYEYRQDSNLLYLTGIEQEDTVLVLVPAARSKRAVVFTKQPNPQQELWTGHILTPAEVTARSGIDHVVQAANPSTAAQEFIEGLLSPGPSGGNVTGEFGTFPAVVKDGKARVGVLDRLATPGGRGAAPAGPPAPGSRAAWAAALREKFPAVTPFSALSIVTTQRQVKTPYEQKVLARSVEISAEAHLEGMKAARPGRWEYEVEAAIEYWYLKHGALSPGYPSIVGSGPNATTLHYLASTRQMEAGDLLLVDAAANFHGLTGDITRTYPISGKFTPAQRDIYELVLAAQEAGITAARLGAAASDISKACTDVFGPGLVKLGLITEAKPEQIRLWLPHGPVHGIGIDVHDPLGQTLVAGSAFVIEPGLYIRPDRLDTLAKTPENAAVLARIRPAVEKYRHIGVRIEDSFLMTDRGVVNLSAKAPRQIAEIERVVGTGR
jgi:Xaa-Pro aminopeptidase